MEEGLFYCSTNEFSRILFVQFEICLHPKESIVERESKNSLTFKISYKSHFGLFRITPCIDGIAIPS